MKRLMRYTVKPSRRSDDPAGSGWELVPDPNGDVVLVREVLELLERLHIPPAPMRPDATVASYNAALRIIAAQLGE